MPIRDQQRLRDYVALISRSIGGLDALAAKPVEAPPAADTGLESTAAEAAFEAGGQKVASDALRDAAAEAARKLPTGRDLTPTEMAATEAIIIPDKRPAFDVVNGRFRVTHPLWTKLEDDETIHQNLIAAIPRIGRIELLNQTRIPFGGTGFVVGEGLIMTNRHVAEIFTSGVGDRNLVWGGQIRPGLDLRRERGRPPGVVLKVRNVRMIHPWWDMALLEVDELPPGLGTLHLAVDDARDLNGHEVAVIGYPGYDPLRNDPDVQDMLFDRTYGVKRLQPGMLAGMRPTESFAKLVDAATHDCSTLGGNSGSALIDLQTGHVIALHFGGRYLDVNYAVPVGELARDSRVRDAGVIFAGPPPAGPAPAWLKTWDDVEASRAVAGGGPPVSPPTRPAPRPDTGSPPSATSGGAGVGRLVFDVPLRITVEFGAAAATSRTEVPLAERTALDFVEAMREPHHEANYGSRGGYNEAFLRGVNVPIPKPRNPDVLAPLKAGGTELKYENFSILMHATRRMALVTASNITRAPQLRRPDPDEDYTRKGLSGLGKNDIEKWFPDPRLEARYQIPDVFFTRDEGAFDKGHLVRREDVAWGRSYEILRRANGDTYHVTNCSPQVSQFNQSSRGEDNWGDLENLVLAEASDEKLCVFAGPILDAADETFVGRGDGGQVLRVKIPARYWKVIVARTQAGIASYGFVLEQDLSDVPTEFAVSENFSRLQVPLSQIEAATGLDFGNDVRNNDAFDSERGLEAAWRGGLVRRETLVTDPDARRATPNAGDDESAEPATATRRITTATEAPGQWRVARSLEALRRQINARAPHRNKASDGTIGDAAHATRASDHNPWVRDGAFGVVTALDITHDPAGGCDAGAIARAIVDRRDARVKYVIWNREIANHASIDGAEPWAWRAYSGANPHTKHVHISVKAEKAAYDDEAAWQV